MIDKHTPASTPETYFQLEKIGAYDCATMRDLKLALNGMKSVLSKSILLFFVLFFVCGSLPAITNIDETDTEKSIEEQLEEELLKQERLITTLMLFTIIAFGVLIALLIFYPLVIYL